MEGGAVMARSTRAQRRRQGWAIAWHVLAWALVLVFLLVNGQ